MLSLGCFQGWKSVLKIEVRRPTFVDDKIEAVLRRFRLNPRIFVVSTEKFLQKNGKGDRKNRLEDERVQILDFVSYKLQ